MKIPDVIFSAGFDRALGWTMLHSIWQATLIALITGVVLLLLRHHSARLRYWVANLALLAILLTAAGTFSYYVQTTPIASATAGRPHPALPSTASAAPVAKAVRTPVFVETAAPVLADPEPGGFRAYFTPHLPLIVSIWFLGVTVFLLRLLGGLSRVYYLRQRMNFPSDPYWTEVLSKLMRQAGLHQAIELLESALVRSPLTIGHLKPVILFPIGLINRLSESEVEAILAHELAHILRRDYLFNILQSLVEAIFYFHPAVWWLSAQVRLERESACDDQAIALLGNKLHYAKALVTMQEMAFYPLSPALAFAGSKRNQLLIRVQRLFFPPTTKFNIMEKWIATGLVVCSLLVLTFGQNLHSSSTRTQTSPPTHNAGIWEADFKGDSVCMTFSSKTEDGNWVNGECFAKNNFANLTVAPGEAAFQMIRPAGTMAMTGKIEANTGYGRFQFTPNDSYRAGLVQQGIQNADDDLLLHCFFANFPADYLTVLKKLGYPAVSRDNLLELAIFRLNEVAIRGYLQMAATLGKEEVPLEELIQLKVANVGPEKVAQLAKAGYSDLDLSEVSQLSLQDVQPAFIDSMNALGFGKLSTEDLLSAKIQGLDPTIVRQYQAMGLGKLSFDDIMSAKIQGLDAAFVAQCQNLDLGKLPFDDIISMKIHGIDAGLVAQYQSLGFGKMNFDDLMSAKIHGIDADFVAQAQNLGLGNLSFDDIVSMKIHGVDADFVKKYQNTGLGPLTFDDVMSAKIQGIDADFVAQCQQLGLGKLTFEEIMSMKALGITPEYVRQCQDMGFGKLGLEYVISMKVQGIDAAFIRQARQLDLGTLSLEDLLNLKIHNITPDMVATFRDLGFKKLTVDDLVSASIHQVTPEFIKEAGRKGYRFPTLEEYADLKIRQQVRPRRAE